MIHKSIIKNKHALSNICTISLDDEYSMFFASFYLEIEFDTPKMLPKLYNTQASCTPTTCIISLVVLMIVYLNIMYV
jgi:hypothetical protein